MDYRNYHTALVFSKVLYLSLRGTQLEDKALELFADIIENELVSPYHVKTAEQSASKIFNTYQTLSPFTRWQRLRRWLLGKAVNT